MTDAATGRVSVPCFDSLALRRIPPPVDVWRVLHAHRDIPASFGGGSPS
ncbi:MAG: hypothetical protein OEY41_17475 [Acidimicrobiia bacterium]|nr:hypothetical protein [Acidimicrobiia bacterium]MDH5291788.1 hypothetical protein [Acidimicrobiia bacterium]